MKRHLLIIASTFCGMILACKICPAQYGIDLAGLQRQQAQFMEAMNQQTRAIDEYQRQLEQKAINDYRQQSGDYQTPDAAVLQHLWQQYYARNPGAFQQQQNESQQWMQLSQRLHNQRMSDMHNNFNSWNATHNDTWNSINAMSMNTFNNGMDSMDRNQAMTINSIYEQGTYVNPYTGHTQNLSFHPNQVQTWGGNHYYTDNQGQQFQFVPGYGYQQMYDYYQNGGGYGN